MEHIHVTWWGCASVEISIGGHNLVIDPFIKPDESKFEYIFCSHEHYDHCHEPTLMKLCKGAAFKKLIASRSCFIATKLVSPTWHEGPLDLAFIPDDKKLALYPKYAKNEGASFPGSTEIDIGRFHVEGVESDEQPTFKEGKSKGEPIPPQMGYLITDTITGLSFYHPGDIWMVFEAMKQMRGKVKYIFYPLGKTRNIERELIEYVRPKYLIPIHYRLNEPDFPIPKNYSDAQPTEEKIKGYWYPTPEDPLGYLRQLEKKLGDLVEIRILRAGKRYEIYP